MSAQIILQNCVKHILLKNTNIRQIFYYQYKPNYIIVEGLEDILTTIQSNVALNPLLQLHL